MCYLFVFLYNRIAHTQILHTVKDFPVFQSWEFALVSNLVELRKAETTSTSTNIHTTRSESFAVFVSIDSFQNAFPRILNIKFDLIVVKILTIRL